MLEIWKQKIIVVVEIVHRWVFGHEMSPTMRIFLSNLNISFFGGVVYSLLIFSFFILAGRFLGPVEYGKYALYSTLFSFLMIFISFGMENAIVRISAKTNKEKKKIIISTFIIFFLCNSIFWSCIFFILKSYIVDFFSVPSSFIFFATLYSMATLLGTAIENYLKILNKFVFVNIIRILQGFLLLLSFIFLYFLFNKSISLVNFVLLNVAVSLIVFVIFFVRIKSYFLFIFDKDVFREFFSFSFAIFLSLIAGYLIQNGTIIFINKFIGLRELGIYNAYYYLSMAISGQLIVFFVSAYFPALSQTEIKLAIIKKIDRLVLLVAMPWLITISSIMFFGISLYGKNYPRDIEIIALFSLYSLFYLYGILYGYIVLSYAKNNTIRNMYSIWILLAFIYFIVLFGLSLFFSVNIKIILSMQVIIFGINVLLNRVFCGKIINKSISN